MSVETDPTGNLRIKFRLPGYPKPIRVPFGMPDNSENRRAAEKCDRLVRKLKSPPCQYDKLLELFPDSKALGEALAAIGIQPDTPDDLTIAGLMDYVQDDYDINNKSNRTKIACTLNHVRNWFQKIPANGVTGDTFTAYKKHRQAQKAANGSINRELSAIRRGYTLAKDAGKIREIPAIHKLDEADPRSGFFEREELAAALKYLPGYLHRLIQIFYITGWRKMEVLNLRTRQVEKNLKLNRLRLEPGETKNGKPRNFPLKVIPQLRDLIAEQLEATRALEKELGAVLPYLFNRPDGERIVGYRKAWDSAMRQSVDAGEVEKRLLPCHDFRRTAVRNLVDGARVPHKLAMYLTGHLTESVFWRYFNVDEGLIEDSAEKLSDFLAEKGPLLAHSENASDEVETGKVQKRL